MAATLAACVLAALAWIGLNQTPPPLRPGTTAGQEGAAHERDVASSTPSPTPSRTPRPQRREALALASGMRVEIVAVRAPCWVSVQADGVDVYTSPGPGLQVGQRAGPFSASDSMDIVLGNPYGVDLVINGARFGPMGRSGDPDTISLPEDAKSLL